MSQNYGCTNLPVSTNFTPSNTKVADPLLEIATVKVPAEIISVPKVTTLAVVSARNRKVSVSPNFALVVTELIVRAEVIAAEPHKWYHRL
jgi:hypothetical protein